MSSAQFDTSSIQHNHLLDQQLAIAVEYFRMSDFDRVLSLLHEAEFTSQPDARRKQMLAITYMSEGRWSEAMEWAQEAIKTDRNSIIARLVIARLKADRGELALAISICEDVVRIDADYLIGQLMLAYYQERQGLHNFALRSYQKAVNMSPQIDILHYILANAHSRVGNHQAAVDTCISALRLNPQIPQSRITLGDIYLGQRRLTEAENEYRCAAELQPMAQEPLRKLGEVLAEQGRHREAVKAFNQSLKLNLKAPFSLLAMGRSLLALQRPQKAHQAFGKILETMPVMPEAILGAARAQLAMGHFRIAERLFKQATDIDPFLQAENRGIYGFDRHKHSILSNDASTASMSIQDEEPWVPLLLNALSNDSFTLRYQRIQPVVADKYNNLYAEVLISLKDHSGNLILPGRFFPTAYHYHLMPLIDRWVVNSTLSFLSQNEPVLNNLAFFSINIADSTLQDEDFEDFVIEKLQQYQIAPYALCLEISETSATINLWRAFRFMTRLKRLGCRFALDVSGSNRLSSVSYLSKLPIDFLKFDARYIQKLTLDKQDRTQVEVITRASHEIKVKTIFEYVEDQRLISQLGEVGVDYVQGYGIAHPDLLINLTIAA
jgi:EAL domain-containing protein (putative c-di-GMP-specific phosphodiesterase class I)/Tfp pilus assembly protein PilF